MNEEYNKIGRNESCPCGSGRKHKHCHLRILQEMEKFARMEKYHLGRKGAENEEVL